MPIDIGMGRGYEIITRAEWGARPHAGRTNITLPTPRLWIHHTAGPERGPSGMRSIQAYHMDVRGWTDIAYSFVIDNVNGAIYEGRGVGVAGGHTRGDNASSHAICLMGNFDHDTPSGTALASIVALARHGRNRGWWTPTLGGHEDAPGASTACPGRNLYRHLPDLRLRVADHQPAPQEDDMPYTAEALNLVVQDAVRDAISVTMGTPGPAVAAFRKRIFDELDTQADRPDSPLRRAIRAELS